MNKVLNVLFPAWILLYATFSWAASATFAQQMHGYDFESLMWSLGAGLLGGVLKSIVTLAGKRRWVLDVVKQIAKDLIVAAIAGLFVYIVLLGVSSVMETYFDMSAIPRDLRVAILAIAGWAPKVFFQGIDRATASAIDRIDESIKNFRKPSDQSDTQPASIVAPLNEP